MLIGADGQPMDTQSNRDEMVDTMTFEARAHFDKMKEDHPEIVEVLLISEIAGTNLANMAGAAKNTFIFIMDARNEGYSDNMFDKDIQTMNRMYEIPNPPIPVPVTVERMLDFKRILIDEINEIDEIIETATQLETMYVSIATPTQEDKELAAKLRLDILVAMADLCCDITVFCASEMLRNGMMMMPCMNVVMSSNFTKLGADGKPIWENGKFQKGPNYRKPEPALRQLIEISMKEQA